MKEYKNEYKFTLVLIHTKNDQVFGLYLDDVLRKLKKPEYIGANESFVFIVKPEIKVYYDAGVNQRMLFAEDTYF
jgi:hypothetical protein